MIFIFWVFSDHMIVHLVSSGHAWKRAEVSDSWLHRSGPCQQQPQHTPQVYLYTLHLSPSLQVRVLCTLCICKLVYSCMQGSKCVSPHQYCDVDLHSQQYVLVIFICFASFIPAVFLVVPSLLQRSYLRATISSISLSQRASTSKEVPMTECWGGSSKKYKLIVQVFSALLHYIL